MYTKKLLRLLASLFIYSLVIYLIHTISFYHTYKEFPPPLAWLLLYTSHIISFHHVCKIFFPIIKSDCYPSWVELLNKVLYLLLLPIHASYDFFFFLNVLCPAGKCCVCNLHKCICLWKMRNGRGFNGGTLWMYLVAGLCCDIGNQVSFNLIGLGCKCQCQFSPLN